MVIKYWPKITFSLSLLQDPTVGRSSHHHHRHICLPVSRQIWYVILFCSYTTTAYQSVFEKLCIPVLIQFFVFVGLRKLEAFFGFLITVMAISFGYEVKPPHVFVDISQFYGDSHVTLTCLTCCRLPLVCAGKARPRGVAEGDVCTLLCRLWACAAGAGGGNRGRRHHAPQHLPALSTGQG